MKGWSDPGFHGGPSCAVVRCVSFCVRFLLQSLHFVTQCSTQCCTGSPERRQTYYKFSASRHRSEKQGTLTFYSLSYEEEIWYAESFSTVCWTALFANLSSLPAAVKIAVSFVQKLWTSRSDKKLPRIPSIPDVVIHITLIAFVIAVMCESRYWSLRHSQTVKSAPKIFQLI